MFPPFLVAWSIAAPILASSLTSIKLGPISACSNAAITFIIIARAPRRAMRFTVLRLKSSFVHWKFADNSDFHANRTTLTRSMGVTQETHDSSAHLCRCSHRRYRKKVEVEWGFRPFKLIHRTLHECQNLTTVCTEMWCSVTSNIPCKYCIAVLCTQVKNIPPKWHPSPPFPV